MFDNLTYTKATYLKLIMIILIVTFLVMADIFSAGVENDMPHKTPNLSSLESINAEIATKFSKCREFDDKIDVALCYAAVVDEQSRVPEVGKWRVAEIWPNDNKEQRIVQFLLLSAKENQITTGKYNSAIIAQCSKESGWNVQIIFPTKQLRYGTDIEVVMDNIPIRVRDKFILSNNKITPVDMLGFIEKLKYTDLLKVVAIKRSRIILEESFSTAKFNEVIRKHADICPAYVEIANTKR